MQYEQLYILVQQTRTVVYSTVFWSSAQYLHEYSRNRVCTSALELFSQSYAWHYLLGVKMSLYKALECAT